MKYDFNNTFNRRSCTNILVISSKHPAEIKNVSYILWPCHDVLFSLNYNGDADDEGRKWKIEKIAINFD